LPRRARLQTDPMTESPGTTNNRPAAAVPPLVAEDHVCPDCGVAHLDVSIERAAEVIGALPACFRAAMAAIPPDAHRRRPEAGTWSVVEYLCHVRDVYATYTARWLVRQAVHEGVHHLRDIEQVGGQVTS
jgi:hypothetical protein